MREAAEIARQYIGQKEITDNAGFLDKEFEKKITNCGFEKGQAWCAYFAELVWKEAFPAKFYNFSKLFSAGAIRTWDNFMKDDGFICDRTPETGAVIIWQHYKDGEPTWQGHAGILDYIDGEFMVTIEGNTNASGGREGIEVAEKRRRINFNTVENGLVLKGFIKFA
jgi:hypothetical protein